MLLSSKETNSPCFSAGQAKVQMLLPKDVSIFEQQKGAVLILFLRFPREIYEPSCLTGAASCMQSRQEDCGHTPAFQSRKLMCTYSRVLPGARSGTRSWRQAKGSHLPLGRAVQPRTAWAPAVCSTPAHRWSTQTGWWRLPCQWSQLSSSEDLRQNRKARIKWRWWHPNRTCSC